MRLYQDGVFDEKLGRRVKPRIRFVGLFDTVPSFGIPGNDIDIGYRFSIPPNVERVRHATAANEHRKMFPLMRLQGANCAPDPRFIEKEFVGAHSDVGGGYKDNAELSKIALRWMWDEMDNAHLPMDPLEASDMTIGEEKIHEPHRKWYYGASKKNGELVRKEFAPPGCPGAFN